MTTGNLTRFLIGAAVVLLCLLLVVGRFFFQNGKEILTPPIPEKTSVIVGWVCQDDAHSAELGGEGAWGFAAETVQLRELETGALLQQTLTRAGGAFFFQVAPGSYSVVLLPATDLLATRPAKLTVLVAENEIESVYFGVTIFEGR